MWLKFFFVSLIILAVSAAYVVGRTHSPPTTATVSGLSPQIESPALQRTVINNPSLPITDNRKNTSTLSEPTPVVAPVTETASPIAATSTEIEHVAAEQPTSQTQQQEILARELEFFEDPSDNSGARDQFIDFFVMREVPGVDLHYVECKDKMCRLELTPANSQAAENFLDNIGTPPFDKGGFYYINQADRSLVLFSNLAD